MPADPQRKKLGQILIERRILTQEALAKALEVQKHESGLLGEILIRLGMVKEEDIVVALATQFHYPYLAVESFNINPEVLQLVNSDLAIKYTFMPIDKAGDLLTVVMADPTGEEALFEIASATKCRVQAFVGMVSEIENAIRKSYQLPSLGRRTSDTQKVSMIFKSSITGSGKEKEKPSG